MAAETGIEWTDMTWNPIVGCSVVSPGCANCYAMAMAGRLGAMVEAHKSAHGGDPGPMAHYEGLTERAKAGAVWTGRVAMASEATLTAPLRWRAPRKVFVNSMGDLFHESVPDAWIDRVFAVMALAPQHTFQVLTKRARRMREYLTRPVQGAWAGRMHTVDDDGNVVDSTDAYRRVFAAMVDQLPKTPAAQLNLAAQIQEPRGDGFMPRWPLPNVWLGVSAERQQEADERIPDLLATPATVRFVSAEPLLGPIDFSDWLTPQYLGSGCNGDAFTEVADWLIVGGESGHSARPMHPDWLRKIRDDCVSSGVAFFFKQWGEFREFDTGPPPHEEVDADSEAAAAFVAASISPAWVTLDGRHFSRPRGLPECVPCRLMERVGKRRAGRRLDGVEHNAFPEARP